MNGIALSSVDGLYPWQGHNTEDLMDLGQRTVVDPMKKLAGEFPHIQVQAVRSSVADPDPAPYQVTYFLLFR